MSTTDRLEALVRDQAAMLERQGRELAELRARLDAVEATAGTSAPPPPTERSTEPGSIGPGPTVPGSTPPGAAATRNGPASAPEAMAASTAARPLDDRTDRRQLLTKAVAAAGAVAGGAALAVAGASPADAATGTFSGAPAVSASGVSGYGIWATSDGYPVVYATATTANPIVYATNGVGAGVWGKSTGSGVVGEGSIGVIGLTTESSQRAQLLLRSYVGLPPPPTRSDAHMHGELCLDQNSDVWLCVADGSPGTWRKVGGPATAGALHVLPATTRVYDSRPGSSPPVGTKAPLANGATRLVSCAFAGAVPTGATAAMVNLTVVNTSASGWLAVHSPAVAWPGNSTVNWFQSGSVIGNLAVVGLDSLARFTARVNTNCSTDLLVDVIGYYR